MSREEEVIYFSEDIGMEKIRSQFFLTFLRKDNVIPTKKVIFLFKDWIATLYLRIADDHVKVSVKGLEVSLYGAVISAEDFNLLLIVHYFLEQIEGGLH